MTLSKATKKRAKQILENYRRYQRQAQLSYTMPSSSDWSTVPKQKSNQRKDRVGTYIARKIDAENEILEIHRAIDQLSEDGLQQILIRKYCQRYKETDISHYMDLGLSESEFYRRLDKALSEFAESYCGGLLLEELGWI